MGLKLVNLLNNHEKAKITFWINDKNCTIGFELMVEI